ncbi:putative lipase YOR059C [Cucurbita pepo subsp. pepo]|uniref:putative lipase YOR059C n=1 Tax=Cucurbita pepo subsp. pepo TaxID=3664 RepID=UPI000C9D9320|nr:putative lipase YOR059C [Cucurbita pepo subsp. pepo]
MENGVCDNGVCSSESVNGGQDVWSSKESDSLSADHLVVMVNGIMGSSTDWRYAAEQFVKRLPDKIFVHCSERNVSKLTLDGVDVMGDRLAEEVLEVIQRKPNLQKISFVAHSVGGLVARHAIGKLYRPAETKKLEASSTNGQPQESSGTIGGLEPVNFVTVATPHLGSRGNKQVPFLFGLAAIEKLASLIIHWILRRTGEHLFMTDDDGGKPPLVQRMIEDQGEYYFMSALMSFKRRVVYSNVDYDHFVGWRTSSIRRISELPKWEDAVNEKYPHVVYEESCKGTNSETSEPTSTEVSYPERLEEELVTGLSRLSWEKVDVCFHKSRHRLAAHSIIQVKDHTAHIEGADVINHIIDHFQT